MSTPDELIADRYRLVRKLGSGGMGVVWEAWDERLHRRVAVKQLRPQPGLAPDELQLANDRAMREARINARLHHRYAVPVFDVAEHDGQPCLIMQYVSSVPLSAVLRDGGPLQPAEAAKVGAQVASALAEAHLAGIVHRDIKPGNILIADDGTALISDFGISHAMGDVTLTQTGMVHGTPAYLAPEVARGGSASFASDVFSLGATLYAALEGGPPFGSDPNSIALLYRVAAGSFDYPQRSGQLAPVLVEMLDGDPEARPDMSTVARRLAALEQQGAAINVLAAESASAPDAAEDQGGPDADEGTAAAASAATLQMPESMRTTRVAKAEPPPPTTEPPPPTTRLAPSAAETVTPVRAAPPARTNPDGDASSDRPRRRPTRILLAVAAVVVAAVLVTAIVLGTRDGTGTAVPTPSVSATESEATNSPTEATPSASDSPSAEASPSPTPTASSASATPTPTRTPSPSATGQATAAELAAVVSDYYALIPGDTDAAWPKLTQSYQRNRTGGRASYDRFWGQVSKVSTSDVSGKPPSSAQATITYTYKNGRVVREKTSFTLVRDDGVLKINATSVLQSN